jgi:phosphoribosyl 1,2-cyclic phosphodiesterase
VLVRAISLASGSSGNALVVEHEGFAMLVDCGLAPRRLATLLREAGIAPTNLGAVLFTHEHSDHVGGVNVVPRTHDIPFVMTPGTFRANPFAGGAPAFARRRVVEQPLGSTRTLGPFEVTSFPVSHDGEEVCGYLIEAGGFTTAVFTDLGVAEDHLREPLAKADLLVIEANHDEQMLWNGQRPGASLQHRLRALPLPGVAGARARGLAGAPLQDQQFRADCLQHGARRIARARLSPGRARNPRPAAAGHGAALGTPGTATGAAIRGLAQAKSCARGRVKPGNTSSPSSESSTPSVATK